MYRRTTSETVTALKEMVPEVRHEYNQVKTLTRLLLVIPASSSTAERSFNALQSLTTWLRSTMCKDL